MKEILEVFGRRLKTLRKERKMTQEELAEKLTLHNSYIGLLERGERIPSLITLDKIAKYFGLKPADLIVEEKRAEKYSMKQKELLYIIRDGAPEEIDKLHKIAKIVMEHPKRVKKPPV